MARAAAAIALALCIVFCVTHEAAAARPRPKESLGGHILQQMRDLKQDGAFNAIENGLVNFDRDGDGAGKRSGCRAWNSLGGISTALGAQGVPTIPPEDDLNVPSERNCPGVITDFNNGK